MRKLDITVFEIKYPDFESILCLLLQSFQLHNYIF
jgi:hypothetical protein